MSTIDAGDLKLGIYTRGDIPKSKSYGGYIYAHWGRGKRKQLISPTVFVLEASNLDVESLVTSSIDSLKKRLIRGRDKLKIPCNFRIFGV